MTTTFDLYSHGMDESDRLDAITIFSSQSSVNTNSNDLSQDFAKCFSIDNVDDNNDDDDIVLLDEDDLINDEVKILLNSLLRKLTDDDIHQSQIENLSNKKKRSIDELNSDEYSIHSKKVRFTISSNETSMTNIFISEQFEASSTQTSRQNQFLSNLGFDLCLEQNLDIYSNLSLETKQNLLNFNKIFHQYPVYSCKYCSFQTNSIHIIENHHQTLHMDKNEKYFCTKCLFRTYRLPVLRRHFQRKHHLTLLTDEFTNRRYQCCFCSFETNYKSKLLKHNQHCQIEQQRTMKANNLLKPDDQPTTIISKEKNNKLETTTTTSNDSIETLIIESDHNISSDEEFIVSSDDDDDDTSTSIEHENHSNTTVPVIQQNSSFTSLSKLLLLNNTPISTGKSALVPIQPRSVNGNEIYQICHICQLYISKSDFAKHMTDKHQKPTVSTPIVILSNPIPTPVTYLQPATTTLIISPPQIPTTIFLLSTSTMNKQLISLNMIKCPWCDTNFEHIDIMTGHLMKFHRMTLAAAKVVVAEQMKIQNSSSNQLSLQFKQEIELIQKEFSDKTYWQLSQPKVYLHPVGDLSCFICQLNVDNLENHFLSTHQIDLLTLNQMKQCCFCGQTNHSSLFEHQLRSHQGVCYSTVLKQFIRFQPPPPVPLAPKKSLSKPSNPRRLTTVTEKKFACRKCLSIGTLLTFDDLVEHLRAIHKIHVKLNRRCIFCQQTFIKGKEYNEHCLQHLNDEYPSIELRRQYIKSRK